MSAQCVVCEVEIDPAAAMEARLADGELRCVCSERCYEALLESPELYLAEPEDEPALAKTS